MRAIVQRVLSASVTVEDRLVGTCQTGLLLLVAAHKDDTEQEVKKLAERIPNLRIFNDAEGKMNLSLKDLTPQGEILAISNFTVLGETKGQRRPSFTTSAPYTQGETLFNLFVDHLKSQNIQVQTGQFGANMQVTLTNDGPVTLVVES